MVGSSHLKAQNRQITESKKVCGLLELGQSWVQEQGVTAEGNRVPLRR